MIAEWEQQESTARERDLILFLRSFDRLADYLVKQNKFVGFGYETALTKRYAVIDKEELQRILQQSVSMEHGKFLETAILLGFIKGSISGNYIYTHNQKKVCYILRNAVWMLKDL